MPSAGPPNGARRRRAPFIDTKNAVTYRVAYRSQRDPELAAGGTEHVLVPVNKKGKRLKNVRTGLGEGIISLGPVGGGKPTRTPRGNAGEAALHGIYFDEREYDYLQHLKPIDESAFLPAEPALSDEHHGRAEPIVPQEEEKDGPNPVAVPSHRYLDGLMPSTSELDIGLLNLAAKDTNAGIELNEDVREVIRALDDEEYADDLEDDFVAKLDAITGSDDDSRLEDDSEVPSDGFSDAGTVGGKTVMSCVTMARSEYLELLDDRFDNVLASEYAVLDSDFEYSDDVGGDSLGRATKWNELDLNEVANEQVCSKKRMTVTELQNELGTPPVEALAKLRLTSRKVVHQDLDTSNREEALVETESLLYGRATVGLRRETPLDCRSVISGLRVDQNLPRTIPVPRSRKQNANKTVHDQSVSGKVSDSTSDESEVEEIPAKTEQGHARPANETREERRERHRLLKLERSKRRQEKKAMKVAVEGEARRRRGCEKNRNQTIVF